MVRAAILIALWQSTPQPHQMRAPVSPRMRARSQSVLALQRGDPTFGAGAPFHQLDEVVGLLDGLAGLAGLALAQHGDEVDAERVEFLVDRALGRSRDLR